VSHRGCLC